MDEEKIEMYAGHMNHLAKVTPDNPQDQPCPRCKKPNKITPLDIKLLNVCKDCEKEITKENIKMMRGWKKRGLI